ncbi:MAG TPA: SH3 domain-containing C40 family peptidase [Terriglobales bacterium]|nr:SH3 domain-containing C40 family peptidase [Terriglobales bacterium]
MRWVVAHPVVNVYSAPSADADVTTQAIYGNTVMQTKPNPAPKQNVPEGWMFIKMADDYTGWTQRNGFLPLDEKEDYAGKEKRVVTVANRAANVYREADVTKHAPVLVLPFETPLEVVSAPKNEGERWIQVRLVDGQQAWVQRGDVQDRTGKALTIDQAIALAKQFLGVTYTWGGTSSFGYDCSGFTQMIERQRGITMPRDADVQAAWTGSITVKREDLKAGDLLYFGSSAKDITHTGMYIGNGEFIHDTTHDHPMVQISRLADQPWTKLLVVARRVK